jgi:transcriptional regulator with XRE-family HTH domain
MRRLPHLRLRKFLTQQQLADEVGVDLNTIQRWEAGDSFPWPKHLQKLCQVLGVDIDGLLESDEWPAKRQGKAVAAA